MNHFEITLVIMSFTCWIKLIFDALIPIKSSTHRELAFQNALFEMYLFQTQSFKTIFSTWIYVAFFHITI